MKRGKKKREGEGGRGKGEGGRGKGGGKNLLGKIFFEGLASSLPFVRAPSHERRRNALFLHHVLFI